MPYRNDEEYIKSTLVYEKFMIWISVGAIIGFAIYGATNHNVIQVTLSHGLRNAISAFGLLSGLYVFTKTSLYARFVKNSELGIQRKLVKYRENMAGKKSEMIAKEIKTTHLVLKCAGILVCWFFGVLFDAALPFNDWMISSFVLGAIGSVILLYSKWFRTMLENQNKSIEQSFERKALYPE